MSDPHFDIGPAIQLLTRQSWHLRQDYDFILPLTPSAFLSGQHRSSNALFKIWSIAEREKADLTGDFDLLSPATPVSSQIISYIDIKFPEAIADSGRILNITLNQGNNRLYVLQSVEQAKTAFHTLHVTRYHFDSHKKYVEKIWGEIPVPFFYNPRLPDPENESAVEAYEDLIASIRTYPQFINFIQSNLEYGGFRGEYLVEYEVFHKYHFMFLYNELIYVVYPVYNPLFKLQDTLPIYQAMSIFCEHTGVLKGTTLLTPPLGLPQYNAAESAYGLVLRTGAFLLDQRLMFTCQQVPLDEVYAQTSIPPIASVSPSLFYTAGLDPVLQETFTYTPTTFFTNLPVESIPTGYSWTSPITYTARADRFILTPDYLNILANMDYDCISVDSSQRYLYGLKDHQVQQFLIEYVGIEIRHPHTGQWLLMSDLSFDSWPFQGSREFRLRNLARRSILHAIQLHVDASSPLRFSSVAGGAKTTALVLSPIKLEPQRATLSGWLHDTRTTNTPWIPQTIHSQYRLEILA